jgi:putative protease
LGVKRFLRICNAPKLPFFCGIAFEAFFKKFAISLFGWFFLAETLVGKAMHSEKLVGKVTHFFGKISVAVVELSAPLKVGDKIRFKKGEEEFVQPVDSMQVEHEQITHAKKGMAIGMKAKMPVSNGTDVFKVEE